MLDSSRVCVQFLSDLITGSVVRRLCVVGNTVLFQHHLPGVPRLTVCGIESPPYILYHVRVCPTSVCPACFLSHILIDMYLCLTLINVWVSFSIPEVSFRLRACWKHLTMFLQRATDSFLSLCSRDMVFSISLKSPGRSCSSS